MLNLKFAIEENAQIHYICYSQSPWAMTNRSNWLDIYSLYPIFSLTQIVLLTNWDQQLTLKVMTELENTLNEYFGKKAPSLPQNAKEIIVKIAPYLAIISVILTIPAILLLFGLGGLATSLAPFGGVSAVTSIPTMWIGILLLIPAAILEVMAIPGLFARTLAAWRYMFWAELISIVSSLVQFNIVGALLNALIGFYILFQVKSFYK